VTIPSNEQPAFLNQMEPWIDEHEVRHMTEYLTSGGWLTEFTKTKDFEGQIAEYTGAKHCVVVTNGTVSMSIAYWARGIGAGDEVLVPDFTMIATPNAVRLVGALPVLVDVEPSTLCMDMALAERALTPRTKAVSLVSLNGRAPNMAAWKTFCAKHNLFLLEDAAQSLGSFQNGTHLGRFGAVGSFSFSTPKIITTGQGGALITDDDQLALRMRKIKDFGRVRGGIDWHDMMGQNFKFTDVQAVLGIEQMKKLAWRVERKKAIYRRYEAALRDVREVEMVPTSAETAPWFVDIYVPQPDLLRDHLKSRMIGSRLVYPPVNRQAIYPTDGVFPVTEDFCGRGLWLPSASFLTDESIDRVCAEIRDFFQSAPAE
jgi:perosamine synthetase